MGVYVVTGGSGGIGGCTVRALQAQGHEVINVDLKGGDISENLASPEGRGAIIRQLHERCPDGIDGLCCVAGVSGDGSNLKLIVSLNYFGAVRLAEGVYDLLKKKHGSCVMISSYSICGGAARQDVVHMLLSAKDDRDEQDILSLCDRFDGSNLSVGNSYYTATKYALALWVRRVSASWAANGVRINSVAPGNVATPMTATMSPQARGALEALPIPINYQTGGLMAPEDIANSVAFLVSPQAHGVNGVILFTDGGTDALLNPDKVY
ncbi:MAG: SDR family oxidoreductase [Oscillospiraceae bacterium]|nr:SDR family oxidoreductase [Oscillospiraceae bacterium]